MDNEKMEHYSFYCACYEKLKVNRKLVFFESHNSSDFAGNLFSIARELSENSDFENLEICISYVQASKLKIEELIKKYAIRCKRLVEWESGEYFELLATAGFLITDVAFYPLYRKKQGQVCVGTWHGTPLKTLGYTYHEDSYVVANQKRGFLLTDYFICPNEYTWECIRESYQLDGLFKGKVIYGGYPRNAVFFDSERRNTVKRELGLEDRKLVVYMPTWRGRVIQVDAKGQLVTLQKLLMDIDRQMPGDYVMLAKLHRLNSSELDFSMFEHIEPFPVEYETYDILNASDILVTDYSSVMFDFELTGKKIVLFCYDKDDYTENRGCYFDIGELPFPIVTETEALVKELCEPKHYDESWFIEKFNPYDSALSTVRVCGEIFKRQQNCISFKPASGSRKRALIFVGELSESRATDSLFFALGNMKDFDCYLTYMNHLFKEKWYKLLQFSGVNQIPMYMYQGRYSNYTSDESRVMAKIKSCISENGEIDANDWKVLEKIGEREYERYLYQNRFDVFVRYAGLDLESLKWFYVYKGYKVLVIHDNMLHKARANAEYRVYLGRAMKEADEIHYACQSVFRQAEELFAGLKNKKVIADLYEIWRKE